MAMLSTQSRVDEAGPNTLKKLKEK